MKRFCIPPEENAAFVQAMEDVLDVYHRPYDPARPQVCLDETSKQLLKHTRVPIAARPGKLACVDDEYKRCGTANIFAAVEPITGRGLVQVTERRTSVDMAQLLRRLSEEEYPKAKAIVLVMDNPNIHGLPCLYEAFEPAEARRLAQRFEIHHTPKHGSWLNVAETFLSMMSRQCLDQRIGTLAELQAAVAAWQASRKSGKVVWRFTTADARIKLRRLYPSIQENQCTSARYSPLRFGRERGGPVLPKGFFVPIIVAVVMIVGAFVAFAVVARNPSGPVVAPPSSTP